MVNQTFIRDYAQEHHELDRYKKKADYSTEGRVKAQKALSQLILELSGCYNMASCHTAIARYKKGLH